MPKLSISQLLQHENVKASIASLAQSDTYTYIQAVAAVIQSEYKCKPNDENWDTYTKIKFGIDELFTRINAIASTGTPGKLAPGQSITAEIEKQNASIDSSRNGSGSRGRARRRRDTEPGAGYFGERIGSE